MIQKKSRRRRNQSVTISGTDFSGRANTIKAKSLTWIRSGNRVRLPPGRVTALRLFLSSGWMVKPGEARVRQKLHLGLVLALLLNQVWVSWVRGVILDLYFV
jgi:hypothetical protein